MVVKKEDQPEVSNSFTADVVWMAEKDLEPNVNTISKEQNSFWNN